MVNYTKLLNTASPKFKLWAIAFLFLFGFWMYYPALSLPPALVDDYSIIANSDHWAEGLKDGDLSTALRKDMSVDQRVFNTGFLLLNAVRYRLTGNQPYHWIKLLELGWVCAFIFAAIYSFGRGKNVAVLGASAAVFVFLSGELPGAINMQSLRANWMRLFTAEPDVLVFLTLHIAALYKMIQRQETNQRVWGWCMIAWVSGLCIFSIKVPYVAVIEGSILVLILLDLVTGKSRMAGPKALVFLAILASFLGYYTLLRSYAPQFSQDSYGANFSLQLSHLWDGLNYTFESLSDIYGPIFPAILAGSIILMGQYWKGRKSNNRWKLYLLAYLMTVTLSSLAIYFPWNSRLPRYLLVGHFGFSLIAGLCVSEAIRMLIPIIRRCRLVLLLVPIGMLSLVFTPWILYCLLFVTCAITFTPFGKVSTAYISGVFLVGILYFIGIVPITRTSINDFYVGGEFANWQTTLQVMKISAADKAVCFAGDVALEDIGSMAGHISRFGIDPQIYPLSDKLHCTSQSLVLINNFTTPPDIVSQFEKNTLLYEFGLSNRSIHVPLSFWQFRNELINDGENKGKFYQIWTYPFNWRIYDNLK